MGARLTASPGGPDSVDCGLSRTPCSPRAFSCRMRDLRVPLGARASPPAPVCPMRAGTPALPGGDRRRQSNGPAPDGFRGGVRSTFVAIRGERRSHGRSGGRTCLQLAGSSEEATMAEPRERADDLSERAAELARQLVAERFPAGADGPRTLAEMEDALAEVKRVLGEQLQRLWIEQQEPAAENRTACAACSGTARFCGGRERLVVTRHGELRFARRYYHCAGCHHGFAPLDHRLGLDGHGTTAQVRGWLADLGSDGAFETAARRLATFTALHLSESTAARVTVEVGRRLRAEELQEAERLLRGE